MITSIQVTGITYDVDKKTHDYVIKRIGKLDRYLPRHARKSVSAEVKLAQVDHDYGNKYEVEVNLRVPNKLISAKDSTSNIMAAIDIVERKLQTQLRDYKESTIAHIGRRGILSRFKRSFRHKL